MQQTLSYWRVVAAGGLLSAFLASACVVTSTTDGNTAGSSNSGAGSSSAGAPAVAGGGNSSGAPSAGSSGAPAANAGGTAVAFECEPASGNPVGTPNSCVPPKGTENACNTCIQMHCCKEFSECYAVEPGNQCGWGGPDSGGEFSCVKACLEDNVQKGNVTDAAALGTCAPPCATKKCNATLIGTQTNDLIACVNDACQMPCFGG